jgi:large subunit ribosomal protein L10
MRTRADKEAEVAQLRERIQRATSLVLSDYRGLTVQEANELRRRLRSVANGGIEYRVTKNRLLRIAVEGTHAEGIRSGLVGPIAVALSYDEPSILAKTLVDYAKENEKFEIKGGLVEGEVVDVAAIRALAALPSKDELRAQLMATIRSPMQNLSSTVYALLGNLRNALEQRQNQIEA